MSAISSIALSQKRQLVLQEIEKLKKLPQTSVYVQHRYVLISYWINVLYRLRVTAKCLELLDKPLQDSDDLDMLDQLLQGLSLH